MADEPQATLKDVLGAIVSGISHARRISDMEVMRIANFYREHDYLEGLSVPRLRINQVVLDLPVLLGESIPGKPCKVHNADTIVAYTVKEGHKFESDVDRFIAKEKGVLRREIYAILRLFRVLFFKENVEALWQDEIGRKLEEQLRTQLPQVFFENNTPPEKYVHLPDVVIADSVRVIVKHHLADLLPKLLEKTILQGLADEEMQEKMELLRPSSDSDAVALLQNDLIRLIMGEKINLNKVMADLKKLPLAQIKEILAKVEYVPSAENKQEILVEFEEAAQMLANTGMQQDSMANQAELFSALSVIKQSVESWTADDRQNVFRETVETAVIRQFVDFMANLAARAAILSPTESSDFYVRVDTESIKNAGTPQAVTRLRLVLREEGLEWMKEEGAEGGETAWKLLAE